MTDKPIKKLVLSEICDIKEDNQPREPWIQEEVTVFKPICCKKPMGKAGMAWSGLNKVQRYRCHKCGKTKLQGAYKKEG